MNSDFNYISIQDIDAGLPRGFGENDVAPAIASARCPPSPPPGACNLPPSTAKGSDTATAAILHAIGARPCSTQMAAGGGISFTPPVIGGAAEQSSMGCEQIQVMSSAVDVLQQSINCLLTSTCSLSDTTVSQTNKFILKDSDPNGGTISVKFRNVAGVVVHTALTGSLQTAVQAKVRDFVGQIAKSIQDSKVGWFGTSEGQKSVTQLKTQATVNSIAETVSKNINSNTFTGIQNNSIVIDITGYDPFSVAGNGRPSNINIDSANIFHYQGWTITNQVLKDFFSTDVGLGIKNGLLSTQKSTAEGVASIFSIGIIIAIIVIGGFVFFGGGLVHEILKYAIPIAIIAAIIIAIVYGVKKEYVVTGLASAAAVLLGGFEFITIKKANEAEAAAE